MAPGSFPSLARDRQEVIRIFSDEISAAQLRLEVNEVTASADASLASVCLLQISTEAIVPIFLFH